MDKCRICLINKNSLVNVFNFVDNDITYADMISSLAYIKIIKDDRTLDKICRSCCKHLLEAYQFKLLIERSDAVLNENSNLKKISFNNIDEFKVEIEIYLDNKKTIQTCEDMKEYFNKEVDEISYNDTIIKKVISKKTGDDVCLKPVPVLEFLRTIQDDLDEDDFTNGDFGMDYYGSHVIDNDGDFIPPEKVLKSNKMKKLTSSLMTANATKEPNHKKKSKKVWNDVCINPVYLKDITLVHAPNKGKRCKKNKKVKESSQLVCPYCGILTKSLKIHILQHSGERRFKCDKCTKAYFSKNGLLAHTKAAHALKKMKCDQCTAVFSIKSALESHKMTHESEAKFVCDICSKAFKRKNALRRHRLSHNSANKSVMCDLCNMSFFTKCGLRHHLRIHTGERPYKCEICSQPYSYKHDFNRHCLKKHGVFFKRRSVYVMNEEVLKQERILMRDLMLRVNGILKDNEPINPFEGPQAALAFDQTIKALQARQIPIDFQF